MLRFMQCIMSYEDSGDIKTNSSNLDMGWNGSGSGSTSISSEIYERLPKASSIQKTEKPSPSIKLKLPRTPSDVMRLATVYRVQQKVAGNSLNYEYKQWCIFVPDPALTKDIKGHTEKITKLVDEMREGIGASMGSNALFMTFVKDNGELDQGVAGFIRNALNMRNRDFPILIICNKPILRISSEGVKKRNISKDEKPDLIILRFGRSTEEEVKKTLTKLGEELAKPDHQISGRGIGLYRQFIRLGLAAKNVGKAAVVVGKEVVIPVVLAYFGSK